MNLLRKNFKTRTKLLFTSLLFQVLLVPNAFAIDVSINGSENLTLMNDIIFDYEASPRIIDFDIANPIVCTEPFDDPNATTILNVNSVLDGNAVLSANFDYSNFVFRVNTDGDVQCATELGVHNDVLFGQSFESSGNNLQIVLKDLLTDEILNSGNTIDLHDGQVYQYKYVIKNTSPNAIIANVLENYLKDASPTFVLRDPVDGWVCSVISGSFSSCGSTISSAGSMSLKNAVIGPFGELEVIATRRVSIETAGPNHKLDLLAAAFPTNVIDSNLNNNIAFTSFGTTTITATDLNIVNSVNNTVAGETITNITVELLDGDGILDANNNGVVNIAISPNSPSGGNLSGSLQTNAINGIATFSGLSIDKANNGYRLRVSSFGLTSDDTNTFNITPNAATHLSISTQPAGAVAQTTMSSVVVHALDEFGNIDTNYTSRVFANIKSGNGNLSGSNPFSVAGIATFDDLSIDSAGTGLTLQFSSGSLQGIISDPFDITAIPSAANSVFNLNTGAQTVGFNAQLSAIIRDVNDNPVGAGVTVSFNMTNSAGVDAPDVQCITGSDGLCSTTVSSTIVGTTTVTASIQEGGISLDPNGNGADEIRWNADVADAQMSNFGAAIAAAGINTSVVLEAELRDQYGNLVPNETVSFEFTNNGATTPPGAFCGALTDINGVCNSNVQSSTTGTTTIRAFFGNPSTEITNSDNYNGLGKTIEWVNPN